MSTTRDVCFLCVKTDENKQKETAKLSDKRNVPHSSYKIYFSWCTVAWLGVKI